MNRTGLAALIVGVGLLFTLGVVGTVLLVKSARERRDAEMHEEAARAEQLREQLLAMEREAGHAEAAMAFGAPTEPDPADEAAFGPVFESLGRALKQGDGAGVAAEFDFDRMVSELEQIGAFDQVPGNAGPGFREGMRNNLKAQFGTLLVANELARWEQTEVRRVRWSPNRQEVVVATLHRNGDDVPLRFRWWLIRRGAGWKIYDFEDLHIGLRSTRSEAAVLTPDLIALMLRDPLIVQRALAGIRDSLARLARHDLDGAEEAVAPARQIHWPPPIQSILELTEGMILIGRGDPAAALARFENSERLAPGAPSCALMRGVAYSALGRHDEAFAELRAYRNELGSDVISCTIEGNSLAAQGKAAEAANAYRRALDEAAASVDAFDGLRRVLPAGKKQELGERLGRLNDPAQIYSLLVSSAQDDKDDEAINVLLDGFLAARPNDPRALADDIRRKVTAEQFTEAAKILTRGLAAGAMRDRDTVLEAYLFAMLRAKKPLDAYAAVPARKAEHAFLTLADDLLEDYSDDGPAPALLASLKELIAAHRKRVSGDPWLSYFEGALLQHAKDYEKADQVLAAGAAKLRPVQEPKEAAAAERFRYRRVECLYHAQKGLDAYQKVGPGNDTFRQLANLYAAAKDLPGLEKLIAAHRTAATGDRELMFWQGRLLYLKGEYNRAIAVYIKYLSENADNGANIWSARDELLRSRLRLDPESAAAALNDSDLDRISMALQAAVAAATDDREELVRLLEASTKGGRKTWFYGDEDFRRAISAGKYRDLRTKYPDPNPPPKLDG
jgi:hypothetical protein